MSDVTYRLHARITGVHEEPTLLFGFEGQVLGYGETDGIVDIDRESLGGEYVLRITVAPTEGKTAAIVIHASDLIETLKEFNLLSRPEAEVDPA